MADKAPVEDIVDALADALRGILQSADYFTDLGRDVLTERSERPAGALRCTVAATNKVRSDDGKQRPANGRGVRGVIEIEIPTSYTDAMRTIYRAEEDIDRCLRQYHQMPGALPVSYEEAVFLDKPEGLPVCGAEIHWQTGYRPRGDD